MKEKSKKEMMLQWVKRQKIVSSVEIRDWGVYNYFLRSDRQMREFAEAGIVRRLPDYEVREMALLKPNQKSIAFWIYN